MTLASRRPTISGISAIVRLNQSAFWRTDRLPPVSGRFGFCGPIVLYVLGGAVGRVWRQFPGALRSYRELSLAGLVGSVIWRPPTTVGSRDRTPTAFAAPHLFILMSDVTETDQTKAALRAAAL